MLLPNARGRGGGAIKGLCFESSNCDIRTNDRGRWRVSGVAIYESLSVSLVDLVFNVLGIPYLYAFILNLENQGTGKWGVSMSPTPLVQKKLTINLTLKSARVTNSGVKQFWRVAPPNSLLPLATPVVSGGGGGVRVGIFHSSIPLFLNLECRGK